MTGLVATSKGLVEIISNFQSKLSSDDYKHAMDEVTKLLSEDEQFSEADVAAAKAAKAGASQIQSYNPMRDRDEDSDKAEQRYVVFVEEVMLTSSCTMLPLCRSAQYRFGALDLKTDSEWFFGYRKDEGIEEFFEDMAGKVQALSGFSPVAPPEHACSLRSLSYLYHEESLSARLTQLLNIGPLWENDNFVRFFNLEEGTSTMPECPEDILQVGMHDEGVARAWWGWRSR